MAEDRPLKPGDRITFRHLPAILDAMAEEGVIIPASLTLSDDGAGFQQAADLRRELADDISSAFLIEAILPGLKRSKPMTAKNNAILELQKAASSLLMKLDAADPSVIEVLNRNEAPPRLLKDKGSSGQLRAQLVAAISNMACEIKRFDDESEKDFEDGALLPDAPGVQPLVLKQMAKIFERHFNAPAKLVYYDRSIGGPFVGFLKALWKQTGRTEWTNGALQKALVRAGLGNKSADIGQ